MADVTSSAENKGTAMNKVADLFVRLGQCGIILAAILMMEHAPGEDAKEFWQYRAVPSLHRRNDTLKSCASWGVTHRSAIRLVQARSCRAHERESSSVVSAWKS
jgi:hypothetical protein